MKDNKKQWYLLVLATAWLFSSLAVTISAFYMTKDPRSLAIATLTAPPIAILSRLYLYHFPPSTADYEIQKLKLQIKLSAVRKKKCVKP